METHLGATISRYGRPVIAEEVPALDFIDAEVRAAVDVQQRRGESLDTKAGLCLGFAGVLGGILLHAGMGNGWAEYAALGADLTVALLSLICYRVRGIPILQPRQLRSYIGFDDVSARRLVLETRLFVHDEITREHRRKARLLNMALTGLVLAVAATAVATAQSLGAGHGTG